MWGGTLPVSLQAGSFVGQLQSVDVAIGAVVGALIVGVVAVLVYWAAPEAIERLVGTSDRPDSELVEQVYTAAVDGSEDRTAKTHDERLEALLTLAEDGELSGTPPEDRAADAPDRQEPAATARFDATNEEIEYALELQTRLESAVQTLESRDRASTDAGLGEALRALTRSPAEGEARLSELAETFEAYRRIENALTDAGAGGENTERLEANLRELDGHDGVAAELRRIVSELRDCRDERRSREEEIRRLETELEEATDRLSEAETLGGRIDGHLDAPPGAAGRDELIDPLRRVVEGLESGRIGVRKTPDAAEGVLSTSDPPRTADVALKRLAAPDEHGRDEIEESLRSVVTDIRRYDSIVKGGAKSIDSAAVRNTADRLLSTLSGLGDARVESVFSEYVESRKSDIDRLSEDNVMTRYAIYQELVGLEDLIRRLESADGPEPSAELRAVASEVEGDIDGLKQRRREQRRFARANNLVEHYIDLAEEMHRSGVEAMNDGEDAVARERFEAARWVVEHTHEMYEGDKKRLLARAAGLSE